MVARAGPEETGAATGCKKPCGHSELRLLFQMMTVQEGRSATGRTKMFKLKRGAVLAVATAAAVALAGCSSGGSGGTGGGDASGGSGGTLTLGVKLAPSTIYEKVSRLV